MDNKTEIEPWPEPVNGEELLNKLAKEFDAFPKEIRTLGPLWLVASYYSDELDPLENYRYTLKRMLVRIPLGNRKKFLLLLRGIAHPSFRPLLDQRLAELPSLMGGN